jgi:NitT/TauT family transport system substrate-binding protein
LALVVILSLVGAACGDDDATTTTGGATTTAADLTEVTVLTPNPSAVIFYPVCTAIHEGFFAEEGLDVTYEALDGSGAVLQAIAAGQAQFGIPGPGPLLGAREAGEDFVGIYNHYATTLFGLVVPEDSAYQTPADLKGVDAPTVIGVGTAEGSEVTFVRPFLLAAGLVEEVDFTFLPVGDGGPATAAFERGEIEAYAAALPDMAIIEARGLPLRDITPDASKSLFGNGFATQQSLIDSDPELVQAFVSGLVKGTAFALDNPEKTLEDCALVNPEEGTDPELAAAMLDLAFDHTKPLGGLPYGTYTVEAWQTWHDNLRADGTLTADQDVTVAFTNQFVEAAYAAG